VLKLDLLDRRWRVSVGLVVRRFFFSRFRDHGVIFAADSAFGVGTPRIGNYSNHFSTTAVRLRTTRELTAPSLA